MQRYLFLALISTLFLGCKSPIGKAQQQSDHMYTNHLINESSPYLLQHAHNPVDWRPWNDETLALAKAENKMLLISVGYSACHWCHVMEHESFEDTTVSKLMNENFISIKVDREERPDVDDVYMTACHLATGKNCGWPLNAFALPDGRPVWAGTYFPKKGWIEVLEYFIKLRKEEPEKLEEYAGQLTEGIQQNEEISFNPSDQVFSKEDLLSIGKNFLANIDYKKGGRSSQIKFPMPNNYQFLLAYHHFTEDPKALEAVTVTLDNMANGGIYDHLGGGFARYSTDPDWHIPHFEKMLYDNSQLVSLYAQAYQLTHNPLYKNVTIETLAFIQRELTDKQGGFYTSLDADSEGEEGKFYVWTKDEIDQVLQDDTMNSLFSDYYEVSAKGNWEEGKNVFKVKQNLSTVAKKYELSDSESQQLLSTAKSKLFNARSERVRPGLDDKVLSSLNALMLKGYVDAYRALGDEQYLKAALRNGHFLVKNMIQEDGRMWRNYKDGKVVVNAFLDDYALTIQAFTALYQVSFEEDWLYQAQKLADYVINHFSDEKSGLFHYTSELDPPLIARKMETADNVIPGSNSTMARALHELGTFLTNENYTKRSSQMMHNIASLIIENPQPNFYSNWCHLYLDLVRPPYEVAVVGNEYKQLRQELQSNYLPHAIFLGGRDEGSLDLLKNKLQEGTTMVYVCQNKVCKFPVEVAEKALALMK